MSRVATKRYVPCLVRDEGLDRGQVIDSPYNLSFRDTHIETDQLSAIYWEHGIVKHTSVEPFALGNNH